MEVLLCVVRPPDGLSCPSLVYRQGVTGGAWRHDKLFHCILTTSSILAEPGCSRIAKVGKEQNTSHGASTLMLAGASHSRDTLSEKQRSVASAQPDRK